MKKLVVIDTYALAHRSYHALPPLVSPEGILVNGVYGFMLVFLKMIQELRPDYLVAAFDLAQPTFRHQEYKEYKAQRAKMPDNFYEQIKIIREILQIWGIPLLEKPGFEADDIIGTLVNKFQNQDLEIIILTGDLDTLQLVNDKVKVATFKKGLQDNVIYDKEEIKKKYGLLPNQLIDYKALKGDPSDNVAGVPGIGEKTALKLIQEFENLDKLYFELENSPEVSKKINSKLQEKLLTYKEQAYLSRHLVTIKTDVDLDFKLEEGIFKPPPQDKLEALFQKLGFESLIKRMFINPERDNKGNQVQINKKEIIIEKIESSEKLNLLNQKIKTAASLGLLLDFQGQKYGERQIFGLYFILSETEIFYLPQNLFSHLKTLKTALDKKLIFTLNAKEIIEEIPDLSDLNFEDLTILAWLIDSERKNYSLENLIKFFLKTNTPLIKPEDYLSQFLNLAETIKIKLTALNLEYVWETIEKPLIPILAQMEKNGILINKQLLQELQQEIDQEIKSLENNIYQLAQKNFNINSYQQLSEVLFDNLHLDTSLLKKNKSGKFSTDVNELTKIKDSHPIIPLILEYRQLEKLKTAFLDPLPSFINEKTQRIHTIWKQTGTATGRLSSESPNLQNIPAKGEWGNKIRKAFEASKGFSFISLDYSQIELRVAAHLSGDPKMIEAFKADKDIHTLTASIINNVEEDKVTPQMRRLAKILNFGIIYGMGIKTLSATAGISLKDAQKIKEHYFQDFKGLKNYLDYSLSQAKKLGYGETIFGRKRFLPLIGSLGQIGRQEERIAINMPIQGLAADIIKLAMIKITDFIKDNNLEEEIKLILQIHDELILEVKSEIIEEVAFKLKTIMEQVVNWEIPLKVEMSIGKNWGELN